MNIKVIGAGCENCGKVYDYVCEAVKELGLDAEIEKVEDLIEIVKLGVMSAPAVMIDGKVVSAGKTLKKKDVVKLLGK
ncbi:thioredoxin family protein [Roseburia hominis]